MYINLVFSFMFQGRGLFICIIQMNIICLIEMAHWSHSHLGRIQRLVAHRCWYTLPRQSCTFCSLENALHCIGSSCWRQARHPPKTDAWSYKSVFWDYLWQFQNPLAFRWFWNSRLCPAFQDRLAQERSRPPAFSWVCASCAKRPSPSDNRWVQIHQPEESVSDQLSWHPWRTSKAEGDRWRSFQTLLELWVCTIHHQISEARSLWGSSFHSLLLLAAELWAPFLCPAFCFGFFHLVGLEHHGVLRDLWNVLYCVSRQYSLGCVLDYQLMKDHNQAPIGTSALAPCWIW